MFVIVCCFHPNLMFLSKDEAYPSVAPSGGRLLTVLSNNRLFSKYLALTNTLAYFAVRNTNDCLTIIGGNG